DGLSTGLAQNPLAERDDQASFLGDRYEAGRADRPAGRMRPAEQGFARPHAARRQIDDRLVLKLERLAEDRFAQVEFKRAPFLQRALHFRSEEAELRAARPFGL